MCKVQKMVYDNKNRMKAILKRLEKVMDLSPPNALSSESVNPPQAYSNFSTSNDNNCTVWDCFSKLNEVNTGKLNNGTISQQHHNDDVLVVKENNNFFHDSWWQGGGPDSIHWEAAALGLASIFIGLGMVGLLLSICSACLRQRRAQVLISRQSRRRMERYSSRTTNGVNDGMNTMNLYL